MFDVVDMHLQEITNDIQVEDDKFECTSKLNWVDIWGWMKTTVSLANVADRDLY